MRLRNHAARAGCVPLALLLVGLAAPLEGQGRADRQEWRTAPAVLETAEFEDYRTPAGVLRDGVLRLTLESREALWSPWGGDGPVLRAHVLAIPGEPSRVPAPLIRVTAGTEVHLTLRNTLGDTMLVRGLRDRGQPPVPNAVVAAFVGDSAIVPPGGEVDVRFTATVPGTFEYFARVLPAGWSATRQQVFGAEGPDRALAGVFIVDPAGMVPPPDERIFLITAWMDEAIPASFDPVARFMINGRSWPHTERLEYTQGDTVRWRVINETGRAHPMHLHGFYFTVDARGDQLREQVFAPEDRRLAVTETLQPSQTMRITWVPREPGNWIFHCHFMRHMSAMQAPPAGMAGPEHEHEHEADRDRSLMGGLVLGITVAPAAGYAAAADLPRRRLALHINRRPGVFGDEPGYGFVMQEGPTAPAADSVRFPGSPIVLTRGEPTEIVVRNRADVPLGVHWHGLELESWADGVPYWSGMPGAASPAVAPGDSFVVRMTPPRAGTFMYHVHSEPGHQLAQGLYGPFLVMEPGEIWERAVDRVFLLGSLGAGVVPPPAVNGMAEPPAVEGMSGVPLRLRFMHISPDDIKRVQLLMDGEPVEWRAIAKDGADLPAAQALTGPADLRIHVGETYDFLWTPERPGELTLRIVTTFDSGLAAFPLEAPPPHTLDIPVVVR